MAIDTEKDPATVTYRVSYLLDQIKVAQAQGFARLETSLSMKADKADIKSLAVRIDEHQVEIGALKQWKHDNELRGNFDVQRRARSWTWKHRAIAVVASVCMVVATVLGPYLAIHLHF